MAERFIAMRARSAFIFCSCALTVLLAPQRALADGDSPLAELGKDLAKIAANPPGGASAGIAVVDVATGTEIFSARGDDPFNPASNVKIVTAVCALKRLGPEFRFATNLYGRQDGVAVRGPLYVKGHADPTLSTADLWSMAQNLATAGVRRIEGGIVVDDTYFDTENLPYAYDQQPDEDNAFRAPVGAVSLNHNSLAITIAPGTQGMRPARVRLDPSEYAVLVNDSVTIASGAHNPKISSTKLDNRTRVRVWGQVPLGTRPVTYFRRIDNPSLFTGYGLKGVLEKVGISVGGEVQVGSVPPGTQLLAEHLSEPLSSVLWETGKVSNNFVTEMVLKTMGAESTGGPGTWEASVSAVAETLAGWGMDEKSYVYRNGSGLFDANRFSARQLVAVLRAAYLDSTIRPEFISQLATGGVDGTIKSRYQARAARRYVRAKTGTLDDVSTLSGYVFDAQGRRPIAFSILVGDASGYVSASRAYQERIVTAIASFLNR